MAKLDQGILGAFSGKVGHVVGMENGGENYMRAWKSRIKNPKTDAQLAQRAKFDLMQSFVNEIANMLEVGFGGRSVKMKPVNAAMSYNIKHAVVGEYPDYEIDFPNVKVSTGRLRPPVNARVSVSPGQLKFTCDDNTGENNAYADDIIIALAYDKDAKESYSCTLTSPGRRHEDPPNLLINIPAHAAGHRMETYMAFYSKKKRKASDSVYCGEVVMVS